MVNMKQKNGVQNYFNSSLDKWNRYGEYETGIGCTESFQQSS